MTQITGKWMFKDVCGCACMCACKEGRKWVKKNPNESQKEVERQGQKERKNRWRNQKCGGKLCTGGTDGQMRTGWMVENSPLFFPLLLRTWHWPENLSSSGSHAGARGPNRILSWFNAWRVPPCVFTTLKKTTKKTGCVSFHMCCGHMVAITALWGRGEDKRCIRWCQRWCLVLDHSSRSSHPLAKQFF